MTLQTIYLWSKKLHRISMWFAILLGAPLTFTGIILENKSLYRLFNDYDLISQVRALHRLTSTKFALVLFVMIVTGFLMWAIPKLLAKKTQASIKS